MFDYYAIGAQSYSFRKFTTVGAIVQLKRLGLSQMEFCAVHFPPDPDSPGLGETLRILEEQGITVPCFGVEAFTADVEANRKKFEFAKKLGSSYLSTDPEPDAFDNLEKLVEEYNIKIAIHNHGPGARYDKVQDTLTAVKGRHPYIGACLDTGHAIRSGEVPHELVEQLGDRLLSLHLKDWKAGGEETILGEGDMDLEKMVSALRSIHFSGFICMEFELDPEDPVPGMLRGLENWRQALGR